VKLLLAFYQWAWLGVPMACQVRSTVVVLWKNKGKKKNLVKKMLSASPLHSSIWAEDPRAWYLVGYTLGINQSSNLKNGTCCWFNSHWRRTGEVAADLSSQQTNKQTKESHHSCPFWWAVLVMTTYFLVLMCFC
jgi:hypothetical protein